MTLTVKDVKDRLLDKVRPYLRITYHQNATAYVRPGSGIVDTDFYKDDAFYRAVQYARETHGWLFEQNAKSRPGVWTVRTPYGDRSEVPERHQRGEQLTRSV